MGYVFMVCVLFMLSLLAKKRVILNHLQREGLRVPVVGQKSEEEIEYVKCNITGSTPFANVGHPHSDYL